MLQTLFATKTDTEPGSGKERDKRRALTHTSQGERYSLVVHVELDQRVQVHVRLVLPSREIVLELDFVSDVLDFLFRGKIADAAEDVWNIIQGEQIRDLSGIIKGKNKRQKKENEKERMNE